LSSNVGLSRAGIDYIKRGIGYYIIVVLNMIGVKLKINAADRQGCGNLGNIEGRVDIA
jgi:hypothetical protein